MNGDPSRSPDPMYRRERPLTGTPLTGADNGK